ncbi:hypothetical protein D5085_10800 [Ectothiorhodospiraceae bacterium BW-2]|nr:hypothetical protein D5085_10800 [Ectothiorhodospiraceae bacterium BW-2]
MPDVIFIDEPELGLHPSAITLIAAMIRRLAAKRQLFIATQSPALVDCFELENIIVADLYDGATTLRSLTSADYQRWLEQDYLNSEIWLKEPLVRNQ